MKKPYLFILFVIACLVLPGAVRPETEAAETQQVLLRAYLRQGINKAFNSISNSLAY